MSTSLSELVDNMTGIFNSIECKSCIENNRCEQCKKLIEELIFQGFQGYINFVMVIYINLFCC